MYEILYILNESSLQKNTNKSVATSQKTRAFYSKAQTFLNFLP